MKFTKTHIAFIISGIILAVTCMLLSSIECLNHIYENGWTMERRSSYMGFWPSHFVIFGLVEIVFLFFRNRILRILAVLVSAAKILLPWVCIIGINAVGLNMYDAAFGYIICNSVPYWVTALAVVLLIQMIVMFFVFWPKKQKAVQ